MVRRDLAGRKIARATSWLDDAAATLSGPLNQVVADPKGLDLAAFYLFLGNCLAGWLEEPAKQLLAKELRRDTMNR